MSYLSYFKVSCKSVNGLSKIAINIGRLICIDQFTACGEKHSFARVLIYVSVDLVLRNLITSGCRGTSFEQEVDTSRRHKLVKCAELYFYPFRWNQPSPTVRVHLHQLKEETRWSACLGTEVSYFGSRWASWIGFQNF